MVRGSSRIINIFSCMLIAYKRVGGWVAKTPIADNFEKIDFFRIFLHDQRDFLSLMLPKYINTPVSCCCMHIGVQKNETTNAK